MPIPQGTTRCSASPASISLPVLDAPAPIRRSKMGPRRAAVLGAVHLAILLHILHWLVYGMTVSPVEPSESMYTINAGRLNTGFVFFVLAILSTFIVGRFFCGWGCHIVAMQDLCGWALKKVGLRPAPFRSRLLVWAPVVLAVYMFAWPTLRREVLRPLLGPAAWAWLAPYVGEAGVRPEIQAAFMTRDFWETFPPWYVAVPFLVLCGFAVVYFLGAKGFCTYGCPYGGVFGPADRLAPGRIRVTDACEHCGHCTAVCTSNVRVHEEVRDYGMVVDPGCMKCMDCVSVCPNHALYFGFGRPAVGARRRADARPRRASRLYDLSRREDLVYGAVFLGMVIGFRGMLGQIPLLMAMGIASIGTYLLWKTVAMVRTPNVRMHGLQLRYRARTRSAGYVVAMVAIGTAAAAAWGVTINASLWFGAALDARIATPLREALAPGFTAAPADRRAAARAEAHLRRAGPPGEGGLGWDRSIDRSLRLARLRALQGDAAGAERALRRGLEYAGPVGALEDPLVLLLRARAQSRESLIAAYRGLLAEYPQLRSTPLLLAPFEAEEGRTEHAVSLIERALAHEPEPRNLIFAANLLVQLERAPLALDAARKGVQQHPGSAPLHELLGLLLARTGQVEAGIQELKAAAKLDPGNPSSAGHISALLRELGRDAEATEWEERAKRASGQGSQR